MTFKFGEVIRNLRTKGFVESRDRHHVYLNFHYLGKKTKWYTYTSHGKDDEDVGDPLVKAMKMQLGLATGRQVKDLVECPMSEAAYIETLKQLQNLPTGVARPGPPAGQRRK